MIKVSKTVIIAALLVAVLAIAIGYANFTTQLTVDGNIGITGDWNVEIIDIRATNIVGLAVAGNPTFTKTRAVFNIGLKKPRDAVTYTITIKNKGNIDVELDIAKWTSQVDTVPAIVYTYTNPSEVLVAGSTTTFTVTATYDKETESVPEITSGSVNALFEYVQAN